MSAGPERLPEVAEAAADGLVAEVYTEIRRVTGVPTVAFVYRALAVDPPELARAWADLAPNLGHPEVRSSGAALGASLAVDVSPVAREAVSVDRAAAAATLASFDRMNRLNLIGLTALLSGVAAPVAPERAAAAPDPIASGLPMPDLASLPRPTVGLLERMSVPVSGAARPILIPSLYRFFATDHALLLGLWEAIQPVVESDALARSAAELRAEARAVARELPYRVRRLEHEPSRAIVERFATTIPAMIVVTGMVRRSLGLGT